MQRTASYGYFPNALSMLYDERYIIINCFDCNLPHCCMIVIRRQKREKQCLAIKYSHVVGLLACFFEPSWFTCIPLPIGAVTLCGHCPLSVCGYRERLMSTQGHLSMMWMGRQWDPQWLPLSMTCLGSDLPWQGGQRPKTKLKDSPVKGCRGQPQRPTNSPVL